MSYEEFVKGYIKSKAKLKELMFLDIIKDSPFVLKEKYVYSRFIMNVHEPITSLVKCMLTNRENFIINGTEGVYMHITDLRTSKRININNFYKSDFNTLKFCTEQEHQFLLYTCKYLMELEVEEDKRNQRQEYINLYCKEEK